MAHLVILPTEYRDVVCHAGSFWWDNNIFRVNFVRKAGRLDRTRSIFFFTFMQRRRNTPGWWYKGHGMVPSFLSDDNTNTFSISTCSFLKSCQSYMHLVNDQRQTMTTTSIHLTIHLIFIHDEQKRPVAYFFSSATTLQVGGIRDLVWFQVSIQMLSRFLHAAFSTYKVPQILPQSSSAYKVPI
ncbi:hypothetical protein BC833DRAFT_570304 [Globomyces pollinis-pini]|nr:hypothetical protein BC833DRAFT_570304 [Globomyces pollinis-pini]